MEITLYFKKRIRGADGKDSGVAPELANQIVDLDYVPRVGDIIVTFDPWRLQVAEVCINLRSVIVRVKNNSHHEPYVVQNNAHVTIHCNNLTDELEFSHPNGMPTII